MGCASARERASQSCTREVAPSMEKFQSSGQRNTPFAWGKREPRNTKEFRDSLPAGVSSLSASEGVEAKEITVGAKSNPPRDMLAFTAPIWSGAGSDFAVSIPPTLVTAPC